MLGLVFLPVQCGVDGNCGGMFSLGSIPTSFREADSEAEKTSLHYLFWVTQRTMHERIVCSIVIVRSLSLHSEQRRN